MTAGNCFPHSIAVGTVPCFQYVKKACITETSTCNTCESALPHARIASMADIEADKYGPELLTSPVSSETVMTKAISLMELGGG